MTFLLSSLRPLKVPEFTKFLSKFFKLQSETLNLSDCVYKT